MTRSRHDLDSPREHRTRLALAALTGLLSGAARAVVDWLLDHLGG